MKMSNYQLSYPEIGIVRVTMQWWWEGVGETERRVGHWDMYFPFIVLTASH